MVQADLQIKLKTELADESFTQGMVSAAVLLLLIDRVRISYAIIDQERQKAVVLKDYQLMTESTTEDRKNYTEGFFTQVYEMDDLLNKLKPDRVILSVYTSIFSLVPDPLYAKDHIKDILNLTCNVTDENRYYADAIRSANAQMVYATEDPLLKETGSVFHEAALYFAGSAFIEQQLRLNKHEETPQVSILVRYLDIDIIVTLGNALKFYNSFSYSSSEDLIYYILFVLEQLQLNPDQVAVTFFGEIDKTSSHWMLASKYIRNLRMGLRSDAIGYSYGFDRLPAHQYVSLFNQYLCVS